MPQREENPPAEKFSGKQTVEGSLGAPALKF